MTLAKYGPNYSCFGFTELKKSLRMRGIETKARDRRRIIAALRKSDRDATFRFLDLPPELRNVVYKLLLTPSKASDGTVRSHPSIITTCKQVHNEVDGLWNDLAGAEVSLSVRSGDGDVIFELCFKGVLLWPVSHKTPINIEEHAIRWPSLLQKVARVTVRLVLDLGIFPASAMKGFQAGKAVNYALQSLQLLLSDDANTDALCVEVLWASKTRDTGLRSIVAPLYALAGRFPTPISDFHQHVGSHKDEH